MEWKARDVQEKRTEAATISVAHFFRTFRHPKLHISSTLKRRTQYVPSVNASVALGELAEVDASSCP